MVSIYRIRVVLLLEICQFNNADSHDSVGVSVILGYLLSEPIFGSIKVICPRQRDTLDVIHVSLNLSILQLILVFYLYIF